MSADGVEADSTGVSAEPPTDAEPTADGWLPRSRVLQESAITLLYLTLLVVGLTVLITIEMLLRL